MDYTTLVNAKTVEGSIKNWVNRSDIPSATIVAEAEAWLWGEAMLRLREMVATETITFSTTSNEQDFPTDGLDPIRFLPFGWSEPLDYRGPDEFNVVYGTTGDVTEGTPSEWALVGTVMKVNLLPSESFAGELLYYAKPTDLQTALTNFVTTRYPTMFRHVLTGFAYGHMKDYAAKENELKLAMALIEQIKMQDDLYRRGSR